MTFLSRICPWCGIRIRGDAKTCLGDRSVEVTCQAEHDPKNGIPANQHPVTDRRGITRWVTDQETTA